jgi:ribose-phosphate pyrophosphokinase
MASHAVMSDPATLRVDQSSLSEIIFTDSIPFSKQSNKVTILPVADMFAEAIRRMCNNESISSLYTIRQERKTTKRVKAQDSKSASF